MIHALDDAVPDLAADAYVAPGAHLIGRVILRAGASVWFNAVLRGDNEPIEIGPGSNVQDGSVLHTDMGFPLTTGADCTIGHMAMLHGCVLADRVLIGMGSTVLNGARIGAGTIIGAGSLVTEGKEIPPGVLAMGRPAKVVRELTERDRQMIDFAARAYQRNSGRYRDGLRDIGA